MSSNYRVIHPRDSCVVGSLSWLEFLGRVIGTELELRGGGLVCAAGSSVAGCARLFPHLE